MKIILLQDVAGVGKKWDVKEAKGGYARNYLLARNLAVLATDKKIKEAKLKQEEGAKKRIIQENLFIKTLETLRDSSVIVEKKANEKGHLYDALDIKEIAGLLKEKINVEIPPEYIKLEKPIKEIGKHKITVAKEGLQDPEVSFEIEIISH